MRCAVLSHSGLEKIVTTRLEAASTTIVTGIWKPSQHILLFRFLIQLFGVNSELDFIANMSDKNRLKFLRLVMLFRECKSIRGSILCLNRSNAWMVDCMSAIISAIALLDTKASLMKAT